MSIRTISLALAGVAIAGAAMAGGHGGDPNVNARKAHMGLYDYNVGILGNMAKGTLEYDANVAMGAANNLVALTTLDQRTYWPMGSDSDSIEGTRASASLWQNFPQVMEIGMNLREAAAAMAAVAGDGRAAIGPALGPLGAPCSACHEKFRDPR